MLFLKQSTAWTETIGPILDSTGAEYTGAVIGDLSISKNGTEAAMAAAATLTHVSNGHYTLVGTAGNSDTLGRLTIRVNKASYQAPTKEYEVLPAATYDALVTNGTLANLDAAVSSRMATYTQPTGFLAATFPSDPADQSLIIQATDALLAAIAALNNLSQANVRTALGLASANLDTQLAAIQADLPARITKNVALAGFEFLMVLASDHATGATGKTVTATRSLDGAAFGACANAVSEVSSGIYKIDLAAGDLNANVVTLRFTATACDDRFVTIITEPT